MSNYRLLGVLTATAVSLGVAFAGAASAATVAFSSTSTWSPAMSNPCSTGCQISNNPFGSATSTYRIGNNTQGADSILSTTNFSTTFQTDQTGVTLGAITWQNAATPSNTTDDNFNLNYNLTINFSQPTLAADSTTFTITVQQPTNPPGDILSNMGIAIPNVGPFALAGVTVSNIRWVLSTPTGGSTFNSATGQWFNPENNTATLRLVADFTATPVPEPASFAILGAGLLGLAAARRTRRQV